MALEDVSVRELAVLIASVLVFELVALSQESQIDLEHRLGERLAQTYAPTAVERNVGAWIALLAVWSQAELVTVVEALGEELERPLPLALVVVQAVHAVLDLVALAELEFSELGILLQVVGA